MLLCVTPHTGHIVTAQARQVAPFEPQTVSMLAGGFLMGSPVAERGRSADEGPQHRVQMEGFWLGKYEMSCDEWDACVMINVKIPVVTIPTILISCYVC